MIGSLDHLTRQLIVHTSSTKRSSDFIAHLEQLDRLYGPQPGRAMKPVVLVEDNGPIHVSKLALLPSKRASIGSPSRYSKYAPELNDIEVVWHDLKAHNLAHYTFTDAADLDRAIHQAVQALNNERSRNPLVNSRISLGRPPGPGHFAIDIVLSQGRIHFAGSGAGDQDERIALGAHSLA